MQRLQKFMARSGVASRRKSEGIIKEGRVKVNGKVITELGMKIDPKKDEIRVDNKIIKQEQFKYILLNKPAGYITTTDDPKGRNTVMDLINVKERIYPVGRLDYDTTGLLLLTNNGEVANKVMHPSYQIDKEYLTTISGTLSEKDVELLENGVKLSDGITAPAEVEIVVEYSNRSIVKITIHEGRKNQIKRMFKKLGYNVQELKRIKIGPLTLDSELKSGRYRFLTKAEEKKLKRALKKK